MSTKRKLIISLCSICLVAAIVVIGVFAFATQTFAINNRVTFTATDVKARVLIKGTNPNNKSESNKDGTIMFPNGSNELYSVGGDYANYGDDADGNEDKAISFAIEANEGSNYNRVKTIPDQRFAGQGEANKVQYVVEIENMGDTAFTATVSDSTLSNLKTANMTTSVEYKFSNGEIAKNGGIVSKGEKYIVTFSYILDDQGLDATMDAPIIFNLQSLANASWIDYAADSYDSGTGKETDPYIIKTAEQLAKVAKDYNTGAQTSYAYYKLGDNIDLKGRQWTPIGNSLENAFNGSFDAETYKINNIELKTDLKYAGLFGTVVGTNTQSAILRNIELSGDIYDITKVDSCIGGIAGYAKFANLEKLTNKSNVAVFIGDDASAGGGVVGKIENSTLTRSLNLGHLSGEISKPAGSVAGVGGIAGYAIASNINNSYNAGNLYGYNHISSGCIAGVVGRAESGSELKFLINYGTVFGSAYNVGVGEIGGLVGIFKESTLSNSLNLGVCGGYDEYLDLGIREITSSSELVSLAESGTISNCYSITEGIPFAIDHVGQTRFELPEYKAKYVDYKIYLNRPESLEIVKLLRSDYADSDWHFGTREWVYADKGWSVEGGRNAYENGRYEAEVYPLIQGKKTETWGEYSSISTITSTGMLYTSVGDAIASRTDSALDPLKMSDCYNANVAFAGYAMLTTRIEDGRKTIGLESSGEAKWSENWDFESIWTIDASVNGGFPSLR